MVCMYVFMCVCMYACMYVWCVTNGICVIYGMYVM